MIAALRHCQDLCDQASAVLVASPDAALRRKQLHLLRECADACSSVARTLSRSGCISEETALRCARILRKCARECMKHPDPFSRHCARACLYAAFVCRYCTRKGRTKLKDHGGKPYVVDIHRAARQNRTFRTARWTENIRSRKSMSETAWKGPRLGSFSFLLNRGRFSRANTGTGSILKRKRVTMMPSWSLAAPDTMS
ncbi:hypothetical protein SAMN04488025_12533 [Planifilum fulgidum]|uniref:Uncharacterized protein n=1 Tax=Planifilum fulgidum TaxID=201973 RepID=A0A1I2QRJ2_9BACL|nr:hypothetical protein SAMN04488025_12533 [Planifilum fulgidum]